jgi:hypothetical protein
MRNGKERLGGGRWVRSPWRNQAGKSDHIRIKVSARFASGDERCRFSVDDAEVRGNFLDESP